MASFLTDEQTSNHDNDLLNGSMNSFVSANNNSYHQQLSGNNISNVSNNNSKAVLAALRALQDKIRRLEIEKSQALDETNQFRNQLKAMEIEFQHTKQRESLSVQKSMQETRSAFDRLQSEKTELEIRCSTLEHQNREIQHHSDDLQKRIFDLEAEKQTHLNKIKELEAENQHIETQIQFAQQHEKDLANTLIKESKRYEADIQLLRERLDKLHKELDKSHRLKESNTDKVSDLDKLIGQLLNVNQSLVEQLSGKSKAASGTTKTTKPTKVQVPRVANIQTVASTANQSKKHSSERTVVVKSDEVTELQKLHKMFATIAQSILDKKEVTTKAAEDVAKPAKLNKTGINSSQGKTTRIRRKSTSSVDRRLSSDHVFGVDLVDKTSNAIKFPVMTTYDDISYSNSVSRQNASPLRNSITSINNGSNDIHSVISSLEQEFESLNHQYKRLLNSNQYDDTGSVLNENESTRAEELINVIQKLHKKGEQLRSLKSPMK